MNPLLLADHLRISTNPVTSGRSRSTGINLRGAALTVTALGVCCALALVAASGYSFEPQPVAESYVASVRG